MNGDDAAGAALAALGWRAFFADQLEADDAGMVPLRISRVHRSRLTALSPDGPVKLQLPVHTNTAAFAVGDWVLADPATHMLHRRLERRTLLERGSDSGRGPQLIAANVDHLFIVTSCNDEFNTARIERYLALANEAGAEPVIVLTKADTADDASAYAEKARALQRDVGVVVVNAKSEEAATALAPWCGAGQTVALVGSSGVGKSTLLNTLAGPSGAVPQRTGAVREEDNKGRHTTTSRSLHTIVGGGWVIDTPGMRSLHVSDMSDGIDVLFAEITELAPACKFRDCTHAHEPGCAVRAAVAAGDISPDRLERWRKLREESGGPGPEQAAPKTGSRAGGKGGRGGRR